MNCPVCQTLNPSGARFCLNCGAALALTCVHCGSELPPNAHFCMNCGQPVGASSQNDADRLTRLTAATPAPLAAKMRASAYLAGEQRIVTALFLDVVGSSNLQQKLGDQAWSEVISEAFNRFYPLIYRYEGTIARVQDDTLLAFFGAPVAHEQDPLRAVYAAQDLQLSALQLAQELDRERKVPFSVRIGLSTGPLIISAINPDLHFYYQPVGNLINLASRIQTLVQAGSIAIAEETYQLIGRHIEVSTHCMLNLEGQQDPTCVYKLERINASTGEIRGLSGFDSQIIGRESELSALLELDETVRAGLGRTVLILGDPGIGKTRLVDEWRVLLASSTDQPELSWYRARGQSHERSSAFYLLTELLYNLLGLSASSPESEKQMRLRGLTDRIFEDPAAAFPYLAQLLGLALSGAELERIHYLDPESKNNQTLTALVGLLRGLAHERPVILVLEDLHWADPSSIDLLSRALPLITAAPLLVCLAARPDRDTPGWELISAARESLGDSLTEIRLAPLSEQESGQLLSNLLSGLELPSRISDLILTNAEGNPLFVEEMIRMLISQGVLVMENSQWKVVEQDSDFLVPATLQALLTARIDRLPLDVRDSLRVASVIGRNFQLSLLEKIAEGQSLIAHMSTLETAGLIRVTQVRPSLAYSFRHAMVHEAIYASLLEEDRRQLHLAVGEALEELYPAQESELAPRLAVHFDAAGDQARAVKYYSLAGEYALAAFANQEAENHFRQALILCDTDTVRSGLLANLGETLFNQGRYFAAIDVWRQAITLLQRQGNREMEARLYARAARSAWYAGDSPGGLAICEEGLERLDPQMETAGAAALLHETARARYFNGQHEQLKEMCQKALRIAEQVQDVNIQADTLATLGLLTTISKEEALQALSQAVELAESHNLLTTAARAHNNLGTILIRLKGDLRNARKHYWRAAEIHNLRGSVSEELFSRINIVDTTFNLGELNSIEEALHGLDTLLEAVPDSQLPTVWLKVLEAELMGSRGDWFRAVEQLRQFRIDPRTQKDLANLGDINRALGWNLFELAQWQQIEDTDESLEALKQALDMYQRSMKPTVSTHCLLAMIHAARAEFNPAQEHFQQAQREAGEDPIPLEEAWVLWAQAKIDAYSGRWESAEQAYQNAVGLVIPIGLRWHWARILKDWAESLILRGEQADLEQAHNLLRQSQELFKQLGAPEYAHRVEQRLQSIASENLVKAAAHQLVSRELAMAGRIQESFLPEMPNLLSGWQLSVTLKPARQTSGDFYDFIPLPGNRLGILIGDVADKGVGAALFMTLSRTLIRTYATEMYKRPEAVFNAANRRMLEDSSVGLFVTAFYGVLELENGLLNYVNAGHNPPLLLRAEHPEQVATLSRTGIPLGIFRDATWGPVQLQLNAGDTLLLYTDGVTEAQDENQAFYSEDRLQAALQKYGAASNRAIHEVQEDILTDISHFVGSQPRLDDLALILLKRERTDPA